MKRCPWGTADELYIRYHDDEWGVPVYDDKKQFEFLVLESAQAGLSWHTILKKRENFRAAYDGFDVQKVAKYDEDKIVELMQNAGIIRNRRKIESSINNAKLFIEIQKEFGSFCNYIWGFVDGKPLVNGWTDISKIPAKTELSDQLSKDMKKRGFKFLGSIILYSHLQATGLVNDHLKSCFRWMECQEANIQG
ncbi:MAG: DNA-3-methyladenine glycosylase I [Candidatus Cloacimonetes bacterium]|jgi:DNA-3-methyladenine glycosylase I|nr:DNA-3-methyladenine glycosylase I [Candidatus Cloacimonadota bacterium]